MQHIKLDTYTHKIMNRAFRKLNLKIAPILLIPLLMTSLTGIILGLGDRFNILPDMVINALLIIHQGGFLGKKLVPFYVLFLGLGVLVVGLTIFIKVRDTLLSRKTKLLTVNIYKVIALILVFPLAVCVQTGVAYRLGTDWLDMTSQQTAIFLPLHTGSPLNAVLGILYTLVTAFGLIVLSIVGVEISLIGKTSLPETKPDSSSIAVQQASTTISWLDNVQVLRTKFRNAIIFFSLVFLVIISWAISAILPSVVIVGVVFTIPAWIIAEGLIKDWQRQKTIQANFNDREDESATILRAIPDSMLRMTQDGICLSYIPAKEISPFVITEEIINKHIKEFLDPKIALRFIKSAQLSLKSGLTHCYRFSVTLDNGGQQYYEARVNAIGISEVLIMIRQLSDLDRASIDSTRLSKFSNEETILLLSEPELVEILELTLGKIQPDNQHHILCCLVVDNLAIDRDSTGVDDELPQDSRISGILMYQIAAKIKFHLSSDYIARLDDSELVTLIRDCSLDRASALVERLRKDLNDFSFQWQGNEYPVNTSIGLLEINADRLDITDLINVAKATCNMARQKVEVKTFW